METYEAPVVDIIELDAADVIAASCTNQTDTTTPEAEA